MIYALILFIATYIAILSFPKIRPYIALGSALLYLVFGFLPLAKIFEYINFNVLLMIAGTMGIVSLFIDSKMPARLADLLVRKVPNVKWAIFLLSLFAGIVSAFIDNVSTVLMIAPIALEIAKKQKINPIGMIIAIAVSSNLQGAATLVGDTTSILLGSYANMNFVEFFFYRGKPGIFFAVELGALVSLLILLVIFRKETAKVSVSKLQEVNEYYSTVLLVLMVVLLIVASFIPNTPYIINGLICMALFLIGLAIKLIKQKNLKSLVKTIKDIDYETLLLLLGLFVVIGGITEMGIVNKLANLFTKIGNGNIFVIYTVIVWGSVLISAFIDNIPYVATMLPVVQGIALSLGIDPTVLYFGLLCGATLGGNLTPIGASANITGIGILRKNGYEVKNKDFLRIGVPFTLAAIIPAYIYIWFVF